MLVLGPEDWRTRIDRLLETFQSQCRRFYSREHLEAGCFVAHNRHGQREEYPLLSLSVGVVHLPAEACQEWMPRTWRRWPPRPSARRRRCQATACT